MGQYPAQAGDINAPLCGDRFWSAAFSTLPRWTVPPACGAVYAAPASGLFLGASDGKGLGAGRGGQSYTFTYAPPVDQSDEDASGTWTYNDEEFDVYNLRTALRSLSASTFTEEASTGQEEISLTVHLDNPDFPSLALTFYRYDGTNCLATIDGESVVFVPRSKTVDLIEAINKVTLGDKKIREIS